jgi:VIT1/CCC1 family predicted Fe2+/Mn2+ transporter
MNSKYEDYFRSFLFGFQDSLVSTTGVIAGLSIGTENKQYVILGVIVTIFVEALSMGAGQYLSEKSVHQLDVKHKDSILLGAFVMLLSYLIAGIVPLTPLYIFDIKYAYIVSVFFSLLSLFLLGVVKGKLVKINIFKSGFEMLLIGGLATFIGVIVGYYFRMN